MVSIPFNYIDDEDEENEAKPKRKTVQKRKSRPDTLGLYLTSDEIAELLFEDDGSD